MLVRNSFLNGLAQKPIESLNSTYTRPTSAFKPVKIKLKWADGNQNNRRDLLCQFSTKTDLLNLKEKDLNKPVVTHLKSKPQKSILKSTCIIDNFTGVFKRPNTGNVKNNDTAMGENPIGNNNNPLVNSKNYNSNFEPQKLKEQPTRQNNFLSINKNNNTGTTRSFTSEPKNDPKNSEFTKIIITPVQSIVNNNINNIYIQSPNSNDIDIKKLTQLYNNNENNTNNLCDNKVSLKN